MQESKLIANLFRTEFSKIVGVLCKTFGIANIQLAEDIASETFLTATETWSLKGVPENPSAWLYAVAKNKTRDYFKRKAVFDTKITPELTNSNNSLQEIEIDWSEKNIEDSQLRMLFTICNPTLSNEAQVSLALRVLCGLGIEEIAAALLTSKSTINKRLLRAKQSYREHTSSIDLPSAEELLPRQDNVLSVIYLLFNEGYYSSVAKKSIRKHLCFESMSLLYNFLNYQSIPKANALMALFCFHASRFEAREDDLGNPILYEDQDTSKWSKELILKGEKYLQKSAIGNMLTKYHLEASIAFWHTKPRDSQEKWESILQLYNCLLQVEYSPITALNRTYALSKADCKKVALKEALKVDLKDNHQYHLLLAELYKGEDKEQELRHLKQALKLANTEVEKKIIQGRIRLVSVNIKF